MNWRRIRKWCLTIGAMSLAGLMIAAWLVAGSLIAPANRHIGEPPADFPASRIQIESESGARLAGWHYSAPDSTATVLLLHPIRGSRLSMLSRAKLFQQHGYSTLLIDLQAHGESPGENITAGFLEQHDVHAAVEYLRRVAPNQQIAIVGRSLGGAATVFANPDVDVIVLESVYPTLTEAVHNRVEMRLGMLHRIVAPILTGQLSLRLGISPTRLRPIDGLSRIQCPLLIASGDSDRHTTLEETRQMFQAANEPKQLVIFEDAGHVDLLEHDAKKYESEVVGFVDRTLGNHYRKLD